MIEGLVEHLTQHLGEFVGGWQKDSDGNQMPFQVVEFESKNDGLVVYSTLGLSEFVLGSARTDDEFRVEHIMMANEDLRGGPIPAIMFEVGNEIIDRGVVSSIGDLFSGSAWLHNISTMSTLYTGRCLFQAESFQSFNNGETVVAFEWLVPIHEVEAEFVRDEGWREFELLMKDENPDLLDFRRESMLVEIP